MVENLPANAGDTGDMSSVLGLGRSSGGEMATQSSILPWEQSHEQRSLVGYSPWGHQESDTTEHTHTHAHTHIYIYAELVFKKISFFIFGALGLCVEQAGFL